jgi:hypothetical protein
VLREAAAAVTSASWRITGSRDPAAIRRRTASSISAECWT